MYYVFIHFFFFFLVFVRFVFFFFFSSRRRHTRCLSDWSSDVCSSDLIPRPIPLAPPVTTATSPSSRNSERGSPTRGIVQRGMVSPGRIRMSRARHRRSEERRVGKEWRYRWAAEY